MNYIHKELEFPSSDGKNRIHAEMFLPIGGEARGVVQLAHGMTDYVGRYTNLAEALCAAGFILAGADHLGHGETVSDPSDFGYFAKKDGYRFVIDDMNRMNSILHEEYPTLPIILLGHSMGSFLSRLYVIEYPRTIDGVIIHGTAGPNPIIPLGKLVVKIIKAFRGERHRSRFVNSLADGGYSKHFDKSEGESAWLTRDLLQVEDRAENPKTNFIFTLSGYLDLFNMLDECNKDSWYEKYPKNLPTLVVSGEDDPVGDFGKGVNYVYNKLRVSGVGAELKLYPGARHELFKELNREEVFSDLIAWIEIIRKAEI